PPALPGATPYRVRVDPAQVAAQVATPADNDFQQAVRLAGNLPVVLRELARDRESAPALLLALLLDTDAQVAACQREAVQAQLGASQAQRMQELAAGPLRDLHAALRLPVATLAF